MTKTSILLPVYNEGESIYNLLAEYLRFGALNPSINFTIIVVNDNSSDETEKFILAAIKDFPKLKINYKKNEFNKGLHGILKGELYSWALEADDSDVIITMDGDNTHNPSLITQMLVEINKGADIVIASRYCKGAKILGLSLFRKVLSLGARLLYSSVWKIEGVKDYTTNYRAYKAEIIKRLVSEYGTGFISEQGFTAVTELLKKTRKFNPIIKEVPITLNYSNKFKPSNMKFFSTILKTLKLIFKK